MKLTPRRSTKAPTQARVQLCLVCTTADCDGADPQPLPLRRRRGVEALTALQCPTCGCLRTISAQLGTPPRLRR